MFDDTDYSLDPEAVSNLKEAGGTEDQPEALQRIRKKILDDLEISNQNRKLYTDKWERLFGEYNNSRKLIRDGRINPRDRDSSDLWFHPRKMRWIFVDDECAMGPCGLFFFFFR